MNREFIFLTDGYRGGANTFMYNHMEYLINRDQKVVLLDTNPKKTFEKLNKKILVYKVDFKKDKKKIQETINKRIKINDNKKIYLMITNYVIFIRYYLFFKNLNRNNFKIILTIHSGIFDLNFKRYVAGLIFSLIYNQIDYLFFGSNSSKSWWKDMYPWMKIENSKIHFNGIKLRKKNIPKKIRNNIHISFAGRIVVENNPEFFMRITSEYLRYNKKAIFNIFGDGLLLRSIKKKYKKKNLRFHGWVKKNKIYKISNIIVITSPVNNFPYVALEAKSYGIPVVSCSKGDIKKIVKNNYDGYLDYSYSERRMALLLKKVEKNYKKFSRNSLTGSKKFELKSSCKKFWNSINV